MDLNPTPAGDDANSPPPVPSEPQVAPDKADAQDASTALESLADEVDRRFRELPDADQKSFRESDLARDLGRAHAEERFRSAQSRLEGYRQAADKLVRDWYTGAPEYVNQLKTGAQMDDATFQRYNQRAAEAMWNAKLFELDDEVRKLDIFKDLAEFELPLSIPHLRDPRSRARIFGSWLGELVERVQAVERVKSESDLKRREADRIKAAETRGQVRAQVPTAPVRTQTQTPSGKTPGDLLEAERLHAAGAITNAQMRGYRRTLKYPGE